MTKTSITKGSTVRTNRYLTADLIMVIIGFFFVLFSAHLQDVRTQEQNRISRIVGDVLPPNLSLYIPAHDTKGAANV